MRQSTTSTYRATTAAILDKTNELLKGARLGDEDPVSLGIGGGNNEIWFTTGKDTAHLKYDKTNEQLVLSTVALTFASNPAGFSRAYDTQHVEERYSDVAFEDLNAECVSRGYQSFADYLTNCRQAL